MSARKAAAIDLTNLEEDIVWTSSVKPLLSEFPDNVQSVYYYGCTQILNNAIAVINANPAVQRMIRRPGFDRVEP